RDHVLASAPSKPSVDLHEIYFEFNSAEITGEAEPQLRELGAALLLIAFEFVPGDVAFVMILDHHFPRPKRLAASVTSSSPAVDDRGALVALPVDVAPRVKWIL